MNRCLTIIAVLFSMLIITSEGNAQKSNINWREMNGNKKVSFYEVQQEFYDYWAGKTPRKGQSYKIFKRWEQYMIPRVYPSGDMRLPSTTYHNYMDWLSASSARGLVSMSSNWSPLGPDTIPTGFDAASGRIDFIRFDPTDSDILYVGAPDGGLWKSTNAGASWSTNTDFLPIIGCSDIAIDPTNTLNMYLATGNWESDRRSIGVLKSTDGGASWNTTSLSWTALDNYKIRKMLMHPSDPEIMMVATDGGVFRTDDAWDNWTEVQCCSNLYDLEFKPGDPSTVYAAGDEFWKSTDNGESWSQVTSTLPSSNNIGRMVLAVTEDDNQYVYAIAGKPDGSFLGLYLSTDSGDTFTLQSSSPNILSAEKDASGTDGQAFHDLAIVVSPTDADEVTIGGINVWQSSDAGVSWTIAAYWLGNDDDYPGEGDSTPDYVHADIQDLQYLPGSNSVLFATCDGGVYKSDNNGGNWSKLSANLSVAQQTCIALSASDPDILVTGLQDIGTLKKDGNTWFGINGGDGEDAFIDRTDNSIIVSSNPRGSHQISFDGGTTGNDILGLPAGEWFTPISQDPVVATTVYAGGRPDLYRKTDLFTNNDGVWEILGTPAGSGNILRFAVSPANNQVIYAIKSDAVSQSTDAGINWTDITGTLPVNNAMLTNLAVSSLDSDKVWVTFSGYSDGEKVYKSTDGGSTWVNMSAGLPNLPINTIVAVTASPNDAVYLGADIGIFYTDNTAGGSWATFNINFPNVAVTDLEIFYPTQKLRASTYGRGAWESDINTIACFQDLVLDDKNGIPTGVYKSDGELSSTNSNVKEGDHVTLKSDTGILLQPMFEVVLGGVMEAIIESCSGNGNQN